MSLRAAITCPKCDRRTIKEKCPNCGFWLKDIVVLADEMMVEFL
jgi:rRNA maturation protein Nop10